MLYLVPDWSVICFRCLPIKILASVSVPLWALSYTLKVLLQFLYIASCRAIVRLIVVISAWTLVNKEHEALFWTREVKSWCTLAISEGTGEFFRVSLALLLGRHDLSFYYIRCSHYPMDITCKSILRVHSQVAWPFLAILFKHLQKYWSFTVLINNFCNSIRWHIAIAVIFHNYFVKMKIKVFHYKFGYCCIDCKLW